MKRILLCIAFSLVIGAIGCTPRVRVTANPKPHDKGIRYYRPKPYLLITSSSELQVTKKGESTTTTTKPDERYVNIQLQYLPDFEEEYAIDVRSGFGVADVNITLDQGWNLTGINQKLDSQTDENLQAAASLVSSIAKAAGTGARGVDGVTASSPSFNVLATNVPLGYYESVIGKDACGKKRLYGFRYIGFVPYQTCPVQPCGIEPMACQTAELYGIVFHNGVMMFKSLSEIQQIGLPERSKSEETGVQVNRTLTYSSEGNPTKVTVQVNDTFPASLERSGELKVMVPKLQGK